MIFRIIILTLCIAIGVKSQDNAGSSVARSLLVCYNKTEILDKEQRPPSSINVLIELISKIESGPSIQNDREISKELIHRFKQDGIIKPLTSTSSPFSVPYTPKGMQADKHRILLKKLVPGNPSNFPDEVLNQVEKCSLHFMLSNNLDVWQRGDENQVCNKLGRFQRRIRRDVNPNDDVEMIDPASQTQSKGNLQVDWESENEPEELEAANEEEETDVFQPPPGTSRQTVTLPLSDCPVENGAVYTRWGTIQAGIVIAGMATGRQPQFIKIQTDKEEDNYVVDSRYAATLVGDLSEVTLHQGAGGIVPLIVGAKGGWNETQAPRWYFINKILNSEMTDAEIRGGLDGLIIAQNINEWKSKASTLKVSQVLDMYYSSRGVFSNKKFRACNRNKIFNEVAPQKDLTEQTIAHSFLLNEEAKLPGTISDEGIKAYSEKAVDALLNYMPDLQDLPCVEEPIERISTDVIIALDFQWDYKIMSRALAYFLDNLDVNKYGSNFTVIDGNQGGYIVESSNSILDFYTTLNKTKYSQVSTGFDVPRVFNAIETAVKRRADENRVNKRAGGQSSIVLFIPYNVLSDNDKSAANSRKQSLKNSYPDLKLLVLGRNSKDSYIELVADPNLDAFVLQESTDGAAITESINSVTARVKQVHRRIINPNCDSSWSGSPSSHPLEQFVEPSTVNYYRISPNYFFGEGVRTIKVRGYGYGNIAVCMSRQRERPQKNSTDAGDKCESISSNEVTFSLTNACSGYDNINSCPPAYISVEAVDNSEESRNVKCIDKGCRFPDNIKYTINTENLECGGSGSYRIVANGLALLVMYLFTIFIL